MLKATVAGVMLASMWTAAYAGDDNHGCTVLLCLANPQGPMAAEDCVQPIKKLYKDLAKGKPFPVCKMQSAPNVPTSQSWAEYGVDYYDPCPPGTSALGSGSYAVSNADSTSPVEGIGEGDSSQSGDKICVGGYQGETWINQGEGDGMTTIVAGIYSQIYSVSPNANPYHADVYIDSRFWHRVRW